MERLESMAADTCRTAWYHHQPDPYICNYICICICRYLYSYGRKNDLAPPRLSYCRSCSAGKATMKSLSSSSLGWTLQPRSAFVLWESNSEKLYISCNLTSFQNTNLNVCALPFPTTPCNISAYLVLLNGWYIFKPDDTSRSDDV